MMDDLRAILTAEEALERDPATRQRMRTDGWLVSHFRLNGGLNRAFQALSALRFETLEYLHEEITVPDPDRSFYVLLGEVQSSDWMDLSREHGIRHSRDEFLTDVIAFRKLLQKMPMIRAEVMDAYYAEMEMKPGTLRHLTGKQRVDAESVLTILGANINIFAHREFTPDNGLPNDVNALAVPDAAMHYVYDHPEKTEVLVQYITERGLLLEQVDWENFLIYADKTASAFRIGVL
jgi:hypothetical protein